MSALRLEAFLAKIYTDRSLRMRFLADPASVAANAGLEPNEIGALVQIDRIGLEFVAQSLERKRQKRSTDKIR